MFQYQPSKISVSKCSRWVIPDKFPPPAPQYPTTVPYYLNTTPHSPCNPSCYPMYVLKNSWNIDLACNPQRQNSLWFYYIALFWTKISCRSDWTKILQNIWKLFCFPPHTRLIPSGNPGSQLMHELDQTFLLHIFFPHPFITKQELPDPI